ncbi:MAG: hypothetical protein MJ240_01905 [Kiritimatiellae bacterium]|nr:hypothetical protein [Kiritimatiellia bacterium]
MAKIEAITAGVNSVNIQHGPESESFRLGDVKLYNYAGLENLTLGQLANALCVHIGVALEDQSVNKMNVITLNARRLKATAKVLEDIMAGMGDYATTLAIPGYEGMTYLDFLTKEMGLSSGPDGVLPSALNTYDERMKVFSLLKEKMTSDATASQQDMVDLQTYMSRRDVAYATASNVIRATGSTLQSTAAACQ